MMQNNCTIPDRAAFFWHGEAMSWMRYWTLRSFRKFNPRTEMLIYSPQEMCVLGRHNDRNPGKYKLREVAEELGATIVKWKEPQLGTLYPHHASDFMEWEYLSTIGGWYLDMDILFVKPLPRVIADAVFCFAADSSVFTIGFLGAKSQSPIFRDILGAAYRHHKTTIHEGSGALAAYAAAGITWKHQSPAQQTLSHFRKKYPRLKIAVIPDKAIYAFRCETVFTEPVPLPKDMVGLHWFGGHPISQKWNALLDEHNWSDYESTFTFAMREARKT